MMNKNGHIFWQEFACLTGMSVSPNWYIEYFIQDQTATCLLGVAIMSPCVGRQS